MFYRVFNTLVSFCSHGVLDAVVNYISYDLFVLFPIAKGSIKNGTRNN